MMGHWDLLSGQYNEPGECETDSGKFSQVECWTEYWSIYSVVCFGHWLHLFKNNVKLWILFLILKCDCVGWFWSVFVWGIMHFEMHLRACHTSGVVRKICIVNYWNDMKLWTDFEIDLEVWLCGNILRFDCVYLSTAVGGVLEQILCLVLWTRWIDIKVWMILWLNFEVWLCEDVSTAGWLFSSMVNWRMGIWDWLDLGCNREDFSTAAYDVLRNIHHYYEIVK